MPVAADSQAILLLCSNLGMPANEGAMPLTLREWNSLAARIASSQLKSPAALLDADEIDLKTKLDLSDEEAHRLRSLLERRESQLLDLKHLETLGIWATTLVDAAYPARLKERLRGSAPAVLFGAGPIDLVGQAGLAIVGSRNVDKAGRAAAEFAGIACAKCGWVVYSGFARGVDEMAMTACMANGGKAVGAIADSLVLAVGDPFICRAIGEGKLTLLATNSPRLPFSAAVALGRNKLIYALADNALVVASDADTGGTWAGATEALKAGYCPLFVRDGANVPDGNRRLLQKGAIACPFPFPDAMEGLPAWMEQQVAGRRQGTLF